MHAMKSAALFLVLAFFLRDHRVYGQPQVKIDSLKAMLETAQADDTRKLHLLNQLGFEYWTVDPAQSEDFGNAASALAMALKDTAQWAMAHRVIGVSHWSRGNMFQALTHLFKSHELYKQIGDKSGEASAAMNIGLVYTDQKDYQLALKHFIDAKNLFEQIDNKERIGSALNNIGSVFLETNNLQEANTFLTRAFRVNMELNFQFGIMETGNRLGLLALKQSNLPQAQKFLTESLQIARKNKDQEHIIKNLENLARVRIQLGKIDEAKRMLDEALPLAQSKNYKKWLRDILLDYRQIYQRKGQFGKALYYADQHEILNDSIFSEEKASQLTRLKMEKEAAEQRQALRLKEQEIALLQQKKKINQLSTLSLVCVLILVIMASIWLFRAQRSRFKIRHEAVKKDLERARQIEEELKQTLLSKDKELTSYTVNFIRKNELIDELRQKIESLRKKLPESSQELNSILNMVQTNSIDKDWDDFKLVFENVHHDFFGKLLRQYPDLTPAELKLCALVYLNLSIKEMASLMGISPDSVKTSRYRLRKKLGLTQEQNLTEFIINYG